MVQNVGRERSQKSDIPVIGTAFLRSGSGPRREIDYIYSTVRTLDELMNTYRIYKRRGDKVTAEGIRIRHPELEYYSAIRRQREQVTKLLKMRKAFEKDENKVAEIDRRIRAHYESIRKLYKIGLMSEEKKL